MGNKCLHCNYDIPLNETLDGDKIPQLGDISFCINCGGLHIFTKNGLKKIQTNMLDEETKKEVKRIEDAWLRTRAMVRLTEDRSTNGN